MEVLPTPDHREHRSAAEERSADQHREAGAGHRSADRRILDLDILDRLDALEAQVDALGERVGHLEASLRDAVAQEVRAASAELRRALTELGRRLVQDLPHELARHRDAIVAELRPPPAPPPPPPPPPPEDPLVDDLDLPEAPPAAVPDTSTAAERRRASRLRRRHG